MTDTKTPTLDESCALVHAALIGFGVNSDELDAFSRITHALDCARGDALARRELSADLVALSKGEPVKTALAEAVRVKHERALAERNPPELPDGAVTRVAIQACINSGVDMSCGACAEVAFTGATTHEHTCKLPHRVRETADELLAQAGSFIAAFDDDDFEPGYKERLLVGIANTGRELERLRADREHLEEAARQLWCRGANGTTKNDEWREAERARKERA